MLTTILYLIAGAFIFAFAFKLIFGLLGLIFKLVGGVLMLPFLIIGGILFLPIIIFALGLSMIIKFLPMIFFGGLIYFIYQKFFSTGKYWYN